MGHNGVGSFLKQTFIRSIRFTEERFPHDQFPYLLN